MDEYIKVEGFPSTIIESSKLLIIGTLPPCNRTWYYQKDKLFWKILETAVYDKCGDTDATKKQFLIRNKIALWDIFKSGYRKDGSSGDKAINFVDKLAPKPESNLIWKNKQNIQTIIINGKNAFEGWFKKYNGGTYTIGYDKEINIGYFIWNKEIKIYPLPATSSRYLNGNKNYIEKWIKVIRKALGINNDDDNPPMAFVVKKPKK